MSTRITRLLPILLLAGCASYAAYTAIGPGTVEYDGLLVTPSGAWNAAPAAASPIARPESGVWTHDGRMLDQLMIIPAVAGGDPLFHPRKDEAPLAVFRPDMLPNEVAELVEASLVRLFGESNVTVDTSNLRPESFGANRGFLFDLLINASEGPNYQGVCGAFVASDKLYLMLFLGAEPYYFDKHRAAALAVIRGARLSSS